MDDEELSIFSKREIGDKVENFVANTLTKKGLTIICTNYLCKMGEVDIIARDRCDIVFLEVRYRKSSLYGGAVESIHRKKQRRISLAAAHYLQKHQLTNKVNCRFDVFAVTGDLFDFEHNWIKAAFLKY